MGLGAHSVERVLARRNFCSQGTKKGATVPRTEVGLLPGHSGPHGHAERCSDLGSLVIPMGLGNGENIGNGVDMPGEEGSQAESVLCSSSGGEAAVSLRAQ